MPLVSYDPAVLERFPTLASTTLHARVDADRLAAVDLEPWLDRARAALAAGPESDLPAVRAWRAVFAAMGLKPTRYRCASEAVLRRLRTTGSLPRVGPLVDLGNAVSAATALPVAVFDLAEVADGLTVRPATGTEEFTAFGGDVERPDPGEVVFADDAGRAHARRWTHRQSARSAVGPGTREVLVVCEAHHDGAAADTRAAVAELAAVLGGEPAPVVTPAEG